MDLLSNTININNNLVIIRYFFMLVLIGTRTRIQTWEPEGLVLKTNAVDHLAILVLLKRKMNFKEKYKMYYTLQIYIYILSLYPFFYCFI